jgi:hypothetical protein
LFGLKRPTGMSRRSLTTRRVRDVIFVDTNVVRSEVFEAAIALQPPNCTSPV